MGRSENDEITALVQDIHCSDGQSNILGDVVTSNGSGTVTISNVAPAGVQTATITSWLTIKVNGIDHFIPMWT